MANFANPADWIAPYLAPLVGQVAAGINTGATLAKIPSAIASQNASTALHRAQIPYMQSHGAYFDAQAAKLAMQQDAEKKYLSLLTGGGDPYSNEAIGLLLQSGKDPSSEIKQATANRKTEEIKKSINRPVAVATGDLPEDVTSLPNDVLFPKAALPEGKDIISHRQQTPREMENRIAQIDPAMVAKEITQEQADTRIKLLEESIEARIDKADKDRIAREEKSNKDRNAKTAKENVSYVDDKGVSVFPNEDGIGFHYEDGNPAKVVLKRGTKGKEKEESPFTKALREKREKTAGGNIPAVGTIIDGYKFNGGNPADKNSWTKVVN